MIPAIVLAAGLSRRMGRFKLTLPWSNTTVIGHVIAVLEAAGLTEIVVVTGHRAAEVSTAIAGTAARTVLNPAYATGEMLSSIQVGLREVIREAHVPAGAGEGGLKLSEMMGTDAHDAVGAIGDENTGRPRSQQPSRSRPAPTGPADAGRLCNGGRGFQPPGGILRAAFVPAVLLCLGDQPQIEVATVRAVLAAGKVEGWSRIVIPSHHMRAGHPILLPAWLWPGILACTSTLRDVMAKHRDATRYLEVDTPSILADLDTPEDYEAGSWKPEGG